MSEISKPNTGGEGRNPESMALGVSRSEGVRDGICPDTYGACSLVSAMPMQSMVTALDCVGGTDNLLERMVEKTNMMEAHRRW